MPRTPNRSASITTPNGTCAAQYPASPNPGTTRATQNGLFADPRSSLVGGRRHLLCHPQLPNGWHTFVFIANDSFGVVERKWALKSAPQVADFMAKNSGPGFLPATIKGGWHRFTPYQYRVDRQKLITARSIGYLFARTGAPLAEGQALAAWPEKTSPIDAKAFLENGGQGGFQRRILRAGTYAINTALFVVLTDEGPHPIPLGDTAKTSALHTLIEIRQGYGPIVIDADRIAIVTVQDGPALEHGEIIAPTIGTDAKLPETFHNSFQDIARSRRRGQAGPPGTGASRGHLLYQPTVRHD